MLYLHADKNNQEIGRYVDKEENFYSVLRRVIAEERPSILVVHDFDLIWKIGRDRRKFKGIIVIADIHEDYPLQVKYKPYLNKLVAQVASAFLKAIFTKVLSRFDGVIYATSFIFDKYQPKVSARQVTINNYPIIENFRSTNQAYRDVDLVYVGGISIKRGADYIARIAQNTPWRMVCAGDFKDAESKLLFEQIGHLSNFEYVGQISHEEVKSLVSRSRIGLVPLHPTENYLTSTPVKLFEYLAGGAYTIASDFPYWQSKFGNIQGLEFIDFNQNTRVYDRIEALLESPNLNEFNPIPSEYHWSAEGEKLLSFIRTLRAL
ncbi:MAG: glycosyltransferase [Oceanospirillaceae bacterium]|nr:glycosyltransferase [Oceanospirillaceae bacterium]